MNPLILLVCSFILTPHKSHCSHIPSNDWNHHNHLRRSMDDTSTSFSDTLEPDFTVFFHYRNLKAGHKMAIYFPPKDPSTTPPLLSKPQSDSIPFSSAHLSHILAIFSVSDEYSSQAEAMRSTLSSCEFPPHETTMFCATSREQMLDSVGRILGPGSEFRAMRTEYLSESISVLQNYTISEAPEMVAGRKSVACHMLPYPYAVYFCHGQDSDYNRVYKMVLVGEDGGRVEAAAVCHLHTWDWDPNNPAFAVLQTLPGALPVCHIFPPDNLLWIP